MANRRNYYSRNSSSRYYRGSSRYSRGSYGSPENSLGFLVLLAIVFLGGVLVNIDKRRVLIIMGISLLAVCVIGVVILLLTRKARRFYEIRKMLRVNDADLSFNFDEMSGTEFEQACVEVLSVNGFTDLQTTKASGDFGVDILGEFDGERYAIQCKRYSKNVGVKALQQVESGCHYYKCDKAAVMTNTYFTEAALELARSNNIILWDRSALVQMLKTQTRGKNSAEAKQIGRVYIDMFRRIYKRRISIVSYTSEFHYLCIKYRITGDIEGIENILDELDQRIGFHHAIEKCDDGIKLVITRS